MYVNLDLFFYVLVTSLLVEFQVKKKYFRDFYATMIKNKVQFGEFSAIDYLCHGQIPTEKPESLHAKTRFITTKAIRVGGGYELHRIEKPVVEDKEQVKLLKHLISIKQASRDDLPREFSYLHESLKLLLKNYLMKNFEIWYTV